MKNKIFTSIKENLGLIALICLSILLTFYRLGNQSFGFDESFSIYITKNWSSLVSTIWNHEANMWIYYIILHFWREFGSSEFAVRSLSAIFAIATVPIIYLLGNFVANKRVALLASLLTVINVAYILYAQETRSYSLVMFLVSLSSYAFLRYNENKIYKVIFIISAPLAIYSHFYAGLVLSAQIFSAFFRKKITSFIPAIIAISLLVTPLFLAPSAHSHQIDWIVTPTLKSLVGVIFFLSGDFPPLFILYSLIFLSCVFFFIKKRDNYNYKYLFVWLILPIISSFIFSLLIKPLYESTYFIICLPPFILLVAIGIDKIKKTWLKIIIIFMIALFSLVRLNLWYTQDEQYKWIIDNKKYDWKTAISYMSSEEKSADVLIVFPYQDKLLYSAYGGKQRIKVIEISSKPYLISGGKLLPKPDVTKISSLRYQHIWLFLHILPEEDFQHNNEQANEIINTLFKKYKLDYTKKYFGVTLIHFSKI